MCHIAPKVQIPRQDRQHTFRLWAGKPRLRINSEKLKCGKAPTLVLGCLHSSDKQLKGPPRSESLAYLQLCQASGPCNTASSSLRQNQRMLASAVRRQ
jgi:hypothetical protein